MQGSEIIAQLTGRDSRYFGLAREVSFTSTHEQYSLGAVIVKGNWVIATGRNKNKSHPMQYRYNRYRGDMRLYHNLHAEIDALIRSGREDLAGADIYVYREDKHGLLSMSKPCKACHNALKYAGIDRVYYTHAAGIAEFALG